MASFRLLGPLNLSHAVAHSHVTLTAFLAGTAAPTPFAAHILMDGGFHHYSPSLAAPIRVLAPQPQPTVHVLDLGDTMVTLHGVPNLSCREGIV